MGTVTRLVLTAAITVLFGVLVASWIGAMYGQIIAQLPQ